ncbi:MAG: hypothetical protein HY077_16290 [Elusimicrobia bacterium]|nr:hypothetical protein [Elusimicrobiota bacterium]
MADAKCPKCGGPLEGFVCRFCGAPSSLVCDVASETKALEEYHRHLAEADAPARERLLLSGFLPSCEPVLIDAGVRLLPFIHGAGYGAAQTSCQRLDAIITKLKLMPQDDDIRRALGVFDEHLKKFKADDARSVAVGFSLIGALIAAIVLFWALSSPSCG